MTLLLRLLFICGLHMARGQGTPTGTGGGLVVGDFGDFGYDQSVGANPIDPSSSNFDANFNPGTDFSMVPDRVNTVNTNPSINMRTNIKPNPNNPSSSNSGANFNPGVVPDTVNTNPGINMGRNVGTNIKPNLGVNVRTNTVSDRDLAAFAKRQNQGTTNNMAMISNTVMGNMPNQPPPAPLTRNNIVGGTEVRKQQQFSSANQKTVLQNQQFSRVDLLGQTGGGSGTGTLVEVINNNPIDNAPIPNNNPRPIGFVNPSNTNAEFVNPSRRNINNNAFQPGVSIQVAQNTGSNIVQTGQEFTQQQQTALDTINSGNTLNTNLNEAVGFPVNEVPPNTPVVTADKCETVSIRPVYEIIHGRKILNPQLFNLSGTKMTCPYGTGYSLATCSCDLMSKEEMADFLRQLGYDDHSGCRADVNINFDKGLLYDETNHWSIEARGVTPKDGVAHFNGNPNTTFILPKYFGNDFRMLAFKFKFRSNAPIRDHPHPLITNCESKSIGGQNPLRNTEPTYGVILHSKSDILTFFVKVEILIKGKLGTSEKKVLLRNLTLPVYDPSKWNTVKFSFDGTRLRGQVNNYYRATHARGLISDRMLYPISIGHCLRYGNFLGELDNIKIYSSCIPEKFIDGERFEIYQQRRGGGNRS